MLGYGAVIVYNEDGKDEIIKMGGGKTHEIDYFLDGLYSTFFWHCFTL